MKTFKMTEAVARKLADFDRYYRATRSHGEWIVWDDKSDHIVEFDWRTIEGACLDLETEEKTR